MESAFCSGPLESVGGLELAGREQTPTHHRAVWFRSLQECLCSRSCWPWSQWRGGEQRECEKNTVVLGPFLGDIFPLSFLQLQGFGTGARQTVTGGQINVVLRCTVLTVRHREAETWEATAPLMPHDGSLCSSFSYTAAFQFCRVCGMWRWGSFAVLFLQELKLGFCPVMAFVSEAATPVAHCLGIADTETEAQRHWTTCSRQQEICGRSGNRPQMSWVFCLNHKTILPVSLVVPSASGIPFTNSTHKQSVARSSDLLVLKRRLEEKMAPLLKWTAATACCPLVLGDEGEGVKEKNFQSWEAFPLLSKLPADISLVL